MLFNTHLTLKMSFRCVVYPKSQFKRFSNVNIMRKFVKENRRVYFTQVKAIVENSMKIIQYLTSFSDLGPKFRLKVCPTFEPWPLIKHWQNFCCRIFFKKFEQGVLGFIQALLRTSVFHEVLSFIAIGHNPTCVSTLVNAAVDSRGVL